MKKFLPLILLCGPLCFFAQVKEISLNKNWRFTPTGEKAWLPATVPGTVHTDLFNNKKIQDPHSSGAEKNLQWIEAANWEYETDFICDKALLQNENLELQFEGLDTYTKIYLNDSLVLQTDNMFRSWSKEVKKYLKEGKNKLSIYFESAVNKGKELAKQLPYTLPEGERVFTRKAQYQYGWDFAPRFVTCGIWKEVKLIAWNHARLGRVNARPFYISDTIAALDFNVDITCKTEGEYQVLITPLEKAFKGHNSILNTPVAVGTATYRMDHRIKNPHLWWCNGIGKANLYGFKVELKKNGKTLDQTVVRTGIREIKLVQEEDSIGQSFYFKLNGKPVFMKGANFIPPDVFLPRVKKTDYEKIIQSAVDANINMLRVWGGGTYADDEFYKLCDENGILVWQDLMFACSMYPGDWDFQQNVRKEVEEQVKRLSGHPSLALWCGNNENSEGWENWGWQKQFKYSKNDSDKIYRDNSFMFERLIPQIIKDADPYDRIDYIPSSPQLGWGHHESLLQGDSHYWGVWWGREPFENYNKKVGRFMSEYGFQSIPMGLANDSIDWKYFQKYSKGFETIEAYMERDFIVPKKPEHYAYVSQVLQARGMQIAIEAHRRAKPHCMGSLYWQLNDCWPGITWSSLDFSGSWKASHYAAKKAFEPILISMIEENDSIGVYVVSDLLKNIPIKLDLQLIDFSGKKLWNKSISMQMPANISQKVISIPSTIASTFKKEEIVLKADLQSLISTLPPVSACYYFVSPKALALQKPEIKISNLSNGFIELRTNTLAKDVFLKGENGDDFSDNFFDLLPGETKTVRVKYAPGSKNPIIKALSLADTL